MSSEKKLRVAILDMYDGVPNQGMRNINDILNSKPVENEWKVYDIRGKSECPTLNDFDIVISTGGPGSPYEGEHTWQLLFKKLLDDILLHNKTNDSKKYAFLICHSFQLAAIHFDIGRVVQRGSTSFGIFPVHKTYYCEDEELFKGLKSPFYTVDSRDWQLIDINEEKLKELGAEILFLEKIRPQIIKPRAIMGIKYSDEVIAVQFHPEADAEGMQYYFKLEEKKMGIIDKHGHKKYFLVMERLEHEDKLPYTQNEFIPKFLKKAYRELYG